jgi:hypothetical protein
MIKNLQDIDRLFIEFLDNYKEEPPENIWQEIENDLNRKDTEKYKTKYRSLRKTFICMMLICASLLAGDVLQLNINNSVRNEVNSISSINKKKLKIIDPNIIKKYKPTGEGVKENLTSILKVTNEKIKQSNLNSISFSDLLNSFDESKRGLFIRPQPIFINTNHDNNPGFISSNSLKNSIVINEIRKQSQGKTKENGAIRKHPFYIIPFISLDHITQRLQVEYEYNNEDKSDYVKREKPDMSNTVGLLFEYGLSNKIAIQSGILSSNSFTSISPTVVRAYQDVSGSYKFKLATTYGLAEIKKTGIPLPQNGDSILLNSAMLQLKYISIPLLLKVNLKPGKLNINSTAGVAINRITSDKAEVNYRTSNILEKETIEKIEGLKNTFFTIIAGAEATYPISKKISVGINPVIRYAITPVNKGTPIKTYPVSICIGAELRVKL